MTKVLIHASTLAKPIAGMGRYTSNLINSMAEIDGSIQFFLDRMPAPHYTFLLDQPNIHCVDYRSNIKADVFWGPSHRLPFFQHRQLPKILTIHDLVAVKHAHTMSLKGRLGSKVYLNSSIKMATEIVCVSKSTADDLAHHFSIKEKRITIVHPSIDPLPIKNKMRFGNPFALFVGTFEPRKNIERMIAAFRQFKDGRESDLKLVLAGGHGWGGIDIKQLIDSAGLGDVVRIFEKPNDTTLSMLYQSCEFLLYPSKYEGFGIPILEAIYHKKPVITSNNSSMPEVAGSAGIYIDPNSTDEIAEAIAMLHENSSLRKTLASNTVTEVKKFDRHLSAQKMIKIFKNY